MYQLLIAFLKSKFFNYTPAPVQPHNYNPQKNDRSHAISYSGKLLLRQEINLDEPTFQQLLSNYAFIPVEAISKRISGHQCRRCGNTKRRWFGSLPCANCNQNHVYCRSCILMGRVLACKPLYSWNGPEPAWEKHVDPCKWKGELSRYQHHASEQIASYISKGNKDLLVWAVAGAGKTEMLFEGLSQALQQGKRICIATPRTDVVRELLPRLRRAFPNVTIEGLYGGSPDKESRAQFIVATTHQLIRFNRAFDVIVIDEIDAFPFHMDQSLHFAAHRSAKEAAAKIYLTATPRAEHQKKVQAKTLDVVFVPQRFHGYPLPVPSFRLCLTLRKALATHHPPKAFFQWLDKREYPNRHVIIFVPTISLSEKLMQSLRNMEILQTNNHTYTIDYAHSADAEREQKINNFRNGNINMLITTTILERGVTFPSVDVAVLDAGHSVFDDAALIQIAGRAGRSHIDPTGEVVFFHDAKTDAMVRAVKSIEQMNRRRRKL